MGVFCSFHSAPSGLPGCESEARAAVIVRRRARIAPACALRANTTLDRGQGAWSQSSTNQVPQVNPPIGLTSSMASDQEGSHTVWRRCPVRLAGVSLPSLRLTSHASISRSLESRSTTTSEIKHERSCNFADPLTRLQTRDEKEESPPARAQTRAERRTQHRSPKSETDERKRKDETGGVRDETRQTREGDKVNRPMQERQGPAGKEEKRNRRLRVGDAPSAKESGRREKQGGERRA